MSSVDETTIIHSASLGRLPAGYALVITPTKVMGTKKYTQTHYYAQLSKLDEKGRAEALKLIQDIEKGKQFEFTGDQIESIEIKDPGRFSGGHLLLKTAQQEVKIPVSGTFGTGSGSVLDVLVELLGKMAPGKVTRKK